MNETIRFAWGASTLGDFMVAASDKGLVAVDFGSDRAASEEALKARCPEADIVCAPGPLADLRRQVEEAIEQPGAPCQIPLDPRGSPYDLKVWSMLQAIPAGETTTYGALAAQLGTRDARDITASIAANSIAVLIPCHRVIKKDGTISGYRWGVRRKRELLAREQYRTA